MEYARIEVAMQCVIIKSIQDEVKMRLLRDLTIKSIHKITKIVESAFIKKSVARDATLRHALHKIKLRRRIKVNEYIEMNRQLRDEMKEAVIPEVDFATITIQAIIDGMAENGAWNAFRTSLEMSKAAVYPQNIQEVEDIMKAYAESIPKSNWDKLQWEMPKKDQKKAWETNNNSNNQQWNKYNSQSWNNNNRNRNSQHPQDNGVNKWTGRGGGIANR